MITLLLVIGIILVALWMVGLLARFTLRGGLHILLVIAIILIVLWVITHGR